MSTGGDITTIRLSITGRVQGVWYRGWTVDRAEDLGLAGWVRNITGGSVEVLANGPQDRIDQLIALCRKGPPAARVDGIEVSVVDPPGKGGAFPTKGFQQLGTHNPADFPDRT
jgi:acylphosphatase